MLKNFFTTAYRSLLRNKAFSLINIGGLSVGLAACLLMLLYVADELSYDRFHAHGARVYRVVTDVQPPDNGPVAKINTVGWPVGRVLKEELPEVEEVVYLRYRQPVPIRKEGEILFESGLTADENFLRVFSFPLRKGDPLTALRQPYSLVISAELEQKYFEGQEALGQVLMLYDTIPYTVTGVLEPVPEHSHLQFDLLVSFATFRVNNPEFGTDQGWFDLNMFTYVLLREGVYPALLETKANEAIARRSGDAITKLGYQASLRLQPLSHIYLRSDRGNGLGPASDITYVYLLGTVALFVLLIAGINFVNLTTARAVDRAKEVGVRKVVGSSRRALVGQFLTESFLTCLLAVVLAVVLMELALPFFNEMAGKSISGGAILRPQLLPVLLGVAVGVSLLAGLYPALVLSRLLPAQVLKGTYSTGDRGVRLRQGLVVFQFALSCSLIGGTLVVLHQLRYMQQQELGFRKEQVLLVDARKVPWGSLGAKQEILKQELMAHPAVRAVSAAYAVPGQSGWQGQVAFPEGRPQTQGLDTEYLAVDHDYVRTLGLQVVAGRDFSPEFSSDEENALLVNERAVVEMGWETPANAIGKKIDSPSGHPRGVVVGVLKDYHQHGLQERIRPVVLDVNPEALALLAIRFAPDDLPSALAHVDQVWQKIFPGYPYTHTFLDEEFLRQYGKEVRLTKIFSTFSCLSILVACLGLFGLAAFETAKRTKEIAVRKVLGASVASIVALLSRDFLKLVLLAFGLAAPLVWYGMGRWLQDFAYRIDLEWWIFALAGGLALLIALLTVSFQAAKAALANPVKSLRSE
jgi:putative ABC transport system permease protein